MHNSVTFFKRRGLRVAAVVAIQVTSVALVLDATVLITVEEVLELAFPDI